MSDREFEGLLYIITTNVVSLIMQKTGWDEDEAMERFVRSKVYAQLENEKTKVWHYSVVMLAQLFDDERSGKLVWEGGI